MGPEISILLYHQAIKLAEMSGNKWNNWPSYFLCLSTHLHITRTIKHPLSHRDCRLLSEFQINEPERFHYFDSKLTFHLLNFLLFYINRHSIYFHFSWFFFFELKFYPFFY